ncbi:unnamed protein product [Caenorhabditis sp. 36 PRJEB53466]|nr:unnamed protein product [Caenorhabditis sp. 36 PRJEB53466]
MSAKFFALLLLACFVADVCSKYVAVMEQNEVDPDDQYDVEEDRKVCFCCRAFVCRHQLCPCSRFTALF